jgi:hypothetical protein
MFQFSSFHKISIFINCERVAKYVKIISIKYSNTETMKLCINACLLRVLSALLCLVCQVACWVLCGVLYVMCVVQSFVWCYVLYVLCGVRCLICLVLHDLSCDVCSRVFTFSVVSGLMNVFCFVKEAITVARFLSSI